MIPIELKLTNFMSYAEMEEPLSFTSFQTAALCGLNGHGKSALLDAMTWALWGQARGTDKRGAGTDDLVRSGATFMAVEYTFELEDQRYRVARTRDKSKSGVTRLDFSVLGGETARPLNGETIAKTQDKIDRTLRMDFETFTNSAFILQGRADSFMAKSPNERKEVLTEILGLSLYDELEEAAKERRRDLDRELIALDAQVAEREGELSRKAEYEESRKRAKGGADALRPEIDKLEPALASLREKKAKREANAARIGDIKRNVETAEKEIAALTGQAAEATKNLMELEKLTGRSAEIETGAAKLAEAKANDEAMATLFTRHSEISAALQAAQSELNAAEAEITAFLTQQRKEAAALKQQASAVPTIEARIDELSAKLTKLNEMEMARDAARTRYTEASKLKAELEGTKPSIVARKAEIEQNVATIREADSCPVCRKGLDAGERKALLTTYAGEIKSLEMQVAATDSETHRLNAELKELQENGKRLTASLAGKDAVQGEFGRLQGELKVAVSARESLDKLTAAIKETERSLTEKSFAKDAAAMAEKLRKELESLEYNKATHERLKADIKELAHCERDLYQLESAKKRSAELEKTLESLRKSMDEKQSSMERDRQRALELEKELASEDATNDIAVLENRLMRLKAEEKSFHETAAVAQAGLERCTILANEKRALLTRREETASAVRTYADLAVAFSKKGIPALIIENAIPEIEEEANVLLRRLSDSKMSIHFLTQKNQKTGGVVETLDLLISDGDGDRKYELFSGGEAFRINFAVRIALSKLLTRRAGARLEMLIIDEGFGSQDDEGRDRLIEAICSVATDFKKIIVITHLEELKEAFPARIEVVKKPGIGSVATVV